MIPGISFFVNDVSYARATDKEGIVLIHGLTQYQPADIRISVSSLSDPLWTPGIAGLRIIPRPGNVPVLEFPVVSTGEISGTVFAREGAESKEASGVVLELVGSKGKVIQKQTTAYDGFYTFAHVPVGDYLIRVTQDISRYIGYLAEKEIHVPPAGAFLDGVNLTLTRLK